MTPKYTDLKYKYLVLINYYLFFIILPSFYLCYQFVNFMQ